ncbi:MAG: B12-binding domain-containing radical SAM protein [Tagaea sp.]|nr:B12-binding domain-containing radical SAM protein [Tagaea sp.]
MATCNSDTLARLAIKPDSNAVEAFLDSALPARRIGRVLLVTPPDTDAELFRWDTAKRGRYTNYPPYGLGVIAAQLRARGVDVALVNLNHAVLRRVAATKAATEFDHTATWKAALDAAIAEARPDLIGVTCMFTMTHASLKQVVAHAADRAGVPVAIGGVHVSNDVERILDDVPEARFAFLREADQAFPAFVDVVERRAGAEKLAQVIFNGGPGEDGKVTRLRFLQEAIPGDAAIDVTPAFDLMDVAENSRFGTVGAFYALKPKGTVFSTSLSNRGCRAQCTFCSVRNFNGKGVRQRDHVAVVDELEMLVARYGVGHVMWLDDDLLKDERRAVAMFDELAKRRLPLTWDASNGLIAASVTEEIAHAMAESGCIAVNIGMESGNPKILREVKKPGTVRNFLNAAEILRKHERIYTSILLMVGFPGETMSMVLDTINVARAMDCDWYRISPLQPLPNTPIYDSMVAQGLIQDVGSKELRFMGGSFGKQTEIEQGLRMAELGFAEAFAAIPLDQVPPADKITDIWFYMNYHLNFHRLFTESRPAKLEQQTAHLKSLADIISPENGFALYFQGVLEHRATGRIAPSLIERLERRLRTSPYWADRFAAFGLSVEDLAGGDFKNKHIPLLMPGGLPPDPTLYAFEAA